VTISDLGIWRLPLGQIDNRQVGLGEIVSNTEDGGSGAGRQGVNEGITKVQPCWMSSFAEAAPGIYRRMSVLFVDLDDLQMTCSDEAFHHSIADWPQAGFQDNPEFDKCRRRDQEAIRVLHGVSHLATY